MDWLIDLAVAAGAALVADAATKKITGKHIHEHVLEWWAGIRDELISWAKMYDYVEVEQFAIWIDTHVAGSLVRVFSTARTSDGEVYTVSEQYVDPEEAYQQFPELRNNAGVDVTSLVYE